MCKAEYTGIAGIQMRSRVIISNTRGRRFWLISSSDYKDDGTNILLDANENAYGPGLDLKEHGKLKNRITNGDSDPRAVDIDLLGLNRYPDP